MLWYFEYPTNIINAKFCMYGLMFVTLSHENYEWISMKLYNDLAYTSK